MGLLKTGNRRNKGVKSESADTAGMGGANFVKDFPGPALICTGALEIIACNKKAEPIVEAMAAVEDGKLASAIHNVALDHMPRLQTVTVGEGDARQVYDLTVVYPGALANQVLVFGKNNTVHRNLTNALIASRQMYKDLVTCTAEFVWETRRDGSFSFVSPRGALGYSAAELDGRYSRNLVAVQPDAGADGENDALFPFDSQQPVENQEVWLTMKNGMPACMVVSSIPVFDEDGIFTGCRGAGHDVTAEISHQADLEKLNDRERMLAEITEAISRELDADRLFEMAGNRIAEAVHTQRVLIQQMDGTGVQKIVFVSGMDEADARKISHEVAKHVTPTDEESGLQFIETADWHVIASPLRYGRSLEGMLVIARPVSAPDWESEDKTLLRAVSDHLSIAMSQIRSRNNLVRLSRTDELTGLLNRRAFNDDMDRRIQHSHRTKLLAALLYVDLDNFKPVNDTFGHQKGDELLKQVSRLMRQNVRAGDLVARLGGDEFACWLEDVSVGEVTEKAENFKRLCNEIPEQMGLGAHRLGFSIGIALFDPMSDEGTQSLISRADAAMYKVKNAGKGDFIIAPPYDGERRSEDVR